MRYPVESFTEAEQARLAPHFTHPDRPVFALVNLPETVKGALFARYSRYPGTLRRLFLDEFADSLDTATGALDETAEGDRAAQLYERIFLGYGDDCIRTYTKKALEMTSTACGSRSLSRATRKGFWSSLSHADLTVAQRDTEAVSHA